MLTAGPRATLGLLSPSDRRIERGDRFTVAFGIWGALTCRAGFVVEDESELPAGIRDYVDRLVGPYFAAVAEWYGALRIGQTGGALQAIVDRHLGDPFFGHLPQRGSPAPPRRVGQLADRRGLDDRAAAREWSSRSTSSRRPGPTTSRRTSRTASRSPTQSLRLAFAAGYPAAWARIEARRRFMADALGIDLHPDVLPFSNIPAWLPPFLLRPDRVMTVAG